MKNLLSILMLLLCSSSLLASSDSLDVDSITPPLKKVTKKAKSVKTNNCFTLCNPYKTNTFCRLIQVGNYNAVKSLIKKGENINSKSIKLTPLMYAARHNRVDIVKLLIENGANLHSRSGENGYTALKWAKLANANESYAIINRALKNKKS